MPKDENGQRSTFNIQRRHRTGEASRDLAIGRWAIRPVAMNTALQSARVNALCLPDIPGIATPYRPSRVTLRLVRCSTLNVEC